MTNLTLGANKEKFLFVCRGPLLRTRGCHLASYLIQLAGMTPARRGRVDDYPYTPRLSKRLWNALTGRMSGGGGKGWTGFFPLMESFLTIDVYDEINEVEILISTCKPERINMEAIINYLECQIGPTTGKRLN